MQIRCENGSVSEVTELEGPLWVPAKWEGVIIANLSLSLSPQGRTFWKRPLSAAWLMQIQRFARLFFRCWPKKEAVYWEILCSRNYISCEYHAHTINEVSCSIRWDRFENKFCKLFIVQESQKQLVNLVWNLNSEEISCGVHKGILCDGCLFSLVLSVDNPSWNRVQWTLWLPVERPALS